MKIKHRALALILSAIMVLTFMPALAFAEDEVRGIPISVQLTPAGDYTAEGYYATDGHWDEDGEDWIATSDEYLKFNSPSLNEGDVLTVTYENSDDPENPITVEYEGVRKYYDDEEWDLQFVAKNDNEDIIYPWTAWVKEQSYENQFDLDSPEEFAVFVYDDGEGNSVYATAEAYLEKYEEPADDDYDFGNLPENLDSIEAIGLDETKNVEINGETRVVTFSFTPDEDGFYAFESYGNADSVGQVRTEAGIVAQNDDYDLDYNHNNNFNFRVGFKGTAGTTYYLQAKAWENENVTFQVKAYNAKWFANAVKRDLYYEGTPVTMEVAVEGDLENGTFNWYRYNNLIKGNGGATLAVSEGGRYYCLVSDGSKSVKVYFNVDLNSVTQGNLYFDYNVSDDTAEVKAAWNYVGDTDYILTKGNVTIPDTVTFADGRARTVTDVNIYAPEMTSVTIPASVNGISEGLGMKNIRWGDDENIASYELIPGFVIYGKTGSAAQAYANKYKITFRDPAAEQAAAAAAAAKAKEAARQGTPDKKIAKVKISKPAAAKKAVTVKWKKLTSKQIKKGKVKKYEIWVCPNKAFGPSDTIMKEVSKSKSSGKVKVPKKGTYYVKVRAIRKVGGVKYVGKWSSPKKVKVKK